MSISYRKGQFARCRLDNQNRIAAAIGAEAVRALMPTEIVRIDPNRVLLTDSSGATQAIANHAVIAQLGGTAPSELLRGFGIELVTKYGER